MTVGTLGYVTDNAFLSVGNSGAGTLLVQSGGVFTQTGAAGLYVGENFGGNGTVIVNGGVLNAGSNAVTIANVAGSAGSVTVENNGTLSNGGFLVGGSGNGTLLIQSGGVFDQTSNSGSGIGFNAGSSGTVIVNGGTLADVGGFFGVGGANASGTLLVENAGQVSTQNSGPAGDISATGTGVAAVTVTSGGTWSANGQVTVGDFGAGSLQISSGGVVNTGSFSVTIGNGSAGSGNVTVASNGTLSAEGLTDGGSGTGLLVVQGGGVVNETGANGLAIGQNSSAYGDLTVTGAGSRVNALGQLDVGQAGAGSLLIENAGTVITGGNTLAPSQGIDVGTTAGAAGAITVTGTHSLLSNTGEFIVGDGGLGSLAIQSGGTVITAPGTSRAWPGPSSATPPRPPAPRST